MSNIHIKVLTDNALGYMYKNIEKVTEQIQKEKTNEWIYTTFPKPIFVEKTYSIEDFALYQNDNLEDLDKDVKNHLAIYNYLKDLPRFILVDERFWLWLYLEKFYGIVRTMMKVNGTSTILDHWMYKQGKRRGVFFGVLSRMYFRVELSENNGNYDLTKWIIEKPERFRNLTWRSFSSEKDLTIGILEGERDACLEMNYEDTSIYTEIAKYISQIGSAKLLDAFSTEEIRKITFDKCIEMLKQSQASCQ